MRNAQGGYLSLSVGRNGAEGNCIFCWSKFVYMLYLKFGVAVHVWRMFGMRNAQGGCDF